ncbi:MAG: TetR family transcriptional regulator [Chitinophagales bacterium]|jgi:AcrR family transcriptional regulator|nr:TetR family transcriptional regulator [Chitinophagales bacterium]
MPKDKTIKRKDQITQIAQHKFREKGYRAVSMRELADHVGIEAASFYNHFDSKESILKEICFRMADEFFKGIEVVINQEKLADKMLERAIKSHIQVITANTDASAVFFHDWRYLSEPFLTEFKALRRNYENIFRKIIKEGMNNGTFDKLDETFTVLTIFSSLNWVYEWYDPQGKFTPEQIAEHLSKLILDGMRK